MRYWIIRLAGGYLLLGLVIALWIKLTTGIFLPTLIILWPFWLRLLFTAIGG